MIDGKVLLDDAEWRIVKAFARADASQVTSYGELSSCLEDARSRVDPASPAKQIAIILLEQFVEEAASHSMPAGRC
jgi:hypothetical protein